MATPTKEVKKEEKAKKAKRKVALGQIHVQATFNNTIITVTDQQGNVLGWASAGSAGFKGSRKGTPYAAQIAAERAIDVSKDFGVTKVDVLVEGIGNGREAAIRAFQSAGITVNSIKDNTGIPHNGCRPRKMRRV